MNNVPIKSVLHTISDAPMEAALRTYEQHKHVPEVQMAMDLRLSIDVLSLQRRVAQLETALMRMKQELAA